MTIQRISTYMVQQRTLGDVGVVQSNLFDLQKQISSGFKTDVFSGLDGQVEQFTALDARVRKSETYVQNNEVALSRLRTTQVTMEKLIEIADDAEDLLTLRRNPVNATALNFSPQMESLKENMAALLNTTFEGRYIFGGTRTDVPPVADPIPEPVAAGSPDDSYYQGSKQNPTLRAQDNLEMEYGVRADDMAFQNIFSAISLAVKADVSNGDAVFATAQDLLQQGMQDLVTAQSKVNSDIVAISAITDRLNDLKLYWRGVKEDVITTDLVTASTQVSLDQAILQASFQSFASINRLRLVDFLN